MILRGDSHCLRSDLELMKRIRSPLTMTVLKQLQELYEARSLRKAAEEDQIDPVCIEIKIRAEFEEYCHLLDLLDDWMQPPVVINTPKRRKKWK